MVSSNAALRVTPLLLKAKMSKHSTHQPTVNVVHDDMARRRRRSRCARCDTDSCEAIQARVSSIHQLRAQVLAGSVAVELPAVKRWAVVERSGRQAAAKVMRVR